MSDILAIPGIGKVTEGTKIIAAGVESVVTAVDAEAGCLTVMAAIPDTADFTEATIEPEDVQQIIGTGEVPTVKTARDFRKEAKVEVSRAYRAMQGRSGLTDADKVVRIMKARAALESAYTLLGSALEQFDPDLLLEAVKGENGHDPAKPLGVEQ